MVVMIQESEGMLNVLYPSKEATMKATFVDDYVNISFHDEETGQEVTVQLHKGTVLTTADKIKEGLITATRPTPVVPFPSTFSQSPF